MPHRAFSRIAAPAALALCSIALHAQQPAEPTAYTVTVRYQITGPALRTTYRLGSKVLVDQVPSPGIPPRTLYFLDTGRSLTWDPANPGAGCARARFHGDEWLDPFSGASDLATPGVTQLGSEVVHGVATRILVSQAKPGFKLWVDPKTGLMMKAEFTPPSSHQAITYLEVTGVRVEPPPATLFEVPARCGNAPPG